MDCFCYNHPDRIAVAKISRKIQELVPEGVKQIIVVSPVCKLCADGARSVGTHLLPLTEKQN